MMKKLLLSLGVILLGISISYAQQSTFKGTVKDNSGSPVAYGNVYLMQEEKILNGGMTDAKGDYQIFGVSAGTYDLEFRGPVDCSNTFRKSAIVIGAGDVRFVDFDVNCATGLPPVTVTWQPPVFDPTNTKSSVRMSGDEVRKTPGRSITNALASLEGVTSSDGKIVSVRGNREEGQQTIIDGVRVRGGSAVSMQSIEDAELIQGGIPAEYGDGTSFTVLTTKGVSKDFHGSVELRGSLEGYNNFLIAGAVTGPILKGKDRNDPARIGFMLTAEAGYNQEGRPLRGGSWIAKQSVIDEVAQSPYSYDVVGSPSVYHYNALYLKEDDFERRRVRKNVQDWNYLLQGKIDFLTGKTHNVRISVGGSYEFSKGQAFTTANSLFNSNRNPEYKTSTMRLNARLNHRVFTNVSDSSLLKNVMYDINVNYTKYNYLQQDPIHKDKLFNYGHVGYFKKERRPFYSYMEEFAVTDSAGQLNYVWYDMYVLQTYYDSVLVFTPATTNPYLTNYTSLFVNTYSPEDVLGYSGLNYDMEAYRTYGALMNGDLPGLIYEMYYPAGYTGVTSFTKTELSSIGANASLSLNIGNHEIKLGYQFEKLTQRSFGISPNYLWTTMRNLQNRHMEQLDLSNPIVSHDTLYFNQLVNTSQQSLFDRNLRESLGQDPYGYDGFWLDIDNYDPDMFSLDMFSAEELLNAADGARLIIDYYGYDYTGGSKDKKKTDIERFFTERDEKGNRLYPTGAYEPVYMALYIQDKFSIKSLLFNVGLRVDRFDANQQVLRDPYMFRPGITVKDLKNIDFSGLTGASDDWYVYVNQRDLVWDGTNDDFSVIAFRSFDEVSGTSTWYNSEGQEIADPESVLGGSGGALLASSIYDTGDDAITITKVRPEAFRDYKVQWSVMPRISFSFPVSENSLFTAHYNIITNRPPNIRINPAQYLFIESLGSSSNNLINNPSLRPQQSIDYEVGFTQKVGEKSAVSIVAYYSEKRNQVQVYRYTGAYPSTYYSYANIDFGTVQGFSFSYTLRRTKNVSLRASYTIQFAKGTGSDPASNVAIIASGQPNLRTLTNLEFDQRHRLSANIDYRFDGGTEYNGPVTVKEKNGKKKTIKWLENTGATLIFSAGSGLPYSRSSTPYSSYVSGTSRRLSGSINGSYRPWTFQCDLRIDKTFTFNLNNNAKDKEGNQKNAKPGFLTVYLDIQNLFNFKNIINVYDYTGNANDDGFLTAAEYQRQIDSQVDVVSFTNYYRMRVDDPYNYSTPFTISLGIQFGF